MKFAQRLKAAGITPQFFGMDEPLYFGHVFVSQGNRIGCRSPISEVARNVANTVRQMRSVFPGVRFGDTEPLTFRPGDTWYQNNQWLVDLGEWLDAYEAEVGDKLAYLRLDLWWNMPWREHMPALSELLRRKGVPLQVIYNGDGRAKTDEAWIDSAIANFKAFESGAWPKPAAAVFQYWTPHPSRVLPEGDPLSATGLVNRYVRWQQTGR